MKTSTEIGSAARRIGEEKTVELVAKAGFDAWDFTMAGEMVEGHFLMEKDYLAKARRLKEIGINNGIFSIDNTFKICMSNGHTLT